MEIPVPISNLIEQVNRVDKHTPDRVFYLEAIVVTPEKQIELITPSAFARLSMFAVNHSDDYRLTALIQPGVYLEDILAFKEDLYIEVIEREGLKQRLRKFRAIPLGDGNPGAAGGHTTLSNLKNNDSLNLVTVTFQLLDLGFSLLRNELVSGINLMSNLHDVLHYYLTIYGKELELEDGDRFRGVDIVTPLDNEKLFKQIVIPPSTKLVKLPSFLQNNEQFGIYTTGLGSYYRAGMWYIYPLFRLGTYNTANRVLDIYRLPNNVAPTLKRTYMQDNERVLTIFSTGNSKVINNRDIEKQNVGVGKRIMSSDLITGDVGYYYNKGEAVTTREDSLSEFKTSDRKSTEEYITLEATPTNNLCKNLTINSFNEGYILEIQWDNSNSALITPGSPLRYFYVEQDSKIVYVEGTLLSIRSEYVKDNVNPSNLTFREKSVLQLWLSHMEPISS